MKKKLGMIIAVMCLWLLIPQTADTVWAAGGATSVSVSSGNVNIGDTVTVTVKASGPSGEKANATMTLSYDANVLQFVNCNTTYGGGGGSVIATGESYTVTLKAIGAGNAALSVSGSDGVIFDTNEEMDSMSGSSASVTVNNAAGGTGTATGNASGGAGTTAGNASGTAAGGTGTQSADNSLKSLTISPGTLSPAFTGKTTTYSAMVGSDVTSIAVSATPVNAKAVVESVTGNTELKAGANTIKVVVKAENGVTATYTINVTKQSGATAEPSDNEQAEETPEQTEYAGETVTVSGTPYQIADDFTAEDIPADFAEGTINYHGTDYKGVSFEKGSLGLLWMKTADAADAGGRFFVYDGTRDTCYPFVKLSHGEKYVIALLAPIDFTMPENYVQTELAAGDAGTITAYQTAQEETELVSDFYMFYAASSDGTEGWYQYDGLEGTYQRANSIGVQQDEEAADDTDITYLQEEYDALSQRYTEEKAFSRNVMAVLVFILAVLVIVIINLLIHRFRKGNNDDFSEDDFADDEEADRAPEAEERKARRGFRGIFAGKEDDGLDGTSDDDMFDERFNENYVAEEDAPVKEKRGKPRELKVLDVSNRKNRQENAVSVEGEEEKQTPSGAETEKPVPTEVKREKPVRAEKVQPIREERQVSAEAGQQKSAPEELKTEKLTRPEKVQPIREEKQISTEMKREKSVRAEKVQPIREEKQISTEMKREKPVRAEKVQPIQKEKPVSAETEQKKPERAGKKEKSAPAAKKTGGLEIIDFNDL